MFLGSGVNFGGKIDRLAEIKTNCSNATTEISASLVGSSKITQKTYLALYSITER